MRLTVYASCFVFCCFLLSLAEAQVKRIQRSKDIENDSRERYSKYRKEENYNSIKNKNGDNKQNCKGKGCDRSQTREFEEDSDSTRNGKYIKLNTKKVNKISDDSDDEPNYKQRKNAFNNRIKEKQVNGRNYEFKKKPKMLLAKEESEEDSEEENVASKKRENKKNDKENEKKQLRVRKPEDYTLSHKSERNKKSRMDADENSEENVKPAPKIKIIKGTKKTKTPINDESEEIPKRNKNKRFVPHDDDDDDDDSDEDNTDEDSDDEGSGETEESEATEDTEEESFNHHKGTCKKKSKCPEKKFPTDDDSDESSERNVKADRRQKIKYSFKFAHEKQKHVASEADNIMKKIHKSKKYKYDDDNDDDSSEEYGHPKRIHYVEEEED